MNVILGDSIPENGRYSMALFDPFAVPIFIVSYNRLSYLHELVLWLEQAGYRDIQIVDNASTYPPLKNYLDTSKHKVWRLEQNYGHLVVWKCKLFDNIINSRHYVVTDCDILPTEDCPADVVAQLYALLEEFSGITKVGFALKIDDLPDCFPFKDDVVAWEKQFWKNPIREGLYPARIDTTFALYRPGIGPTQRAWWDSLRVGGPLCARHLPWYVDGESLSDEDIYYQQALKTEISDWSMTDISTLRKNFLDLRAEIMAVRCDHFLVPTPRTLVRWVYRKCMAMTNTVKR